MSGPSWRLGVMFLWELVSIDGYWNWDDHPLKLSKLDCRTDSNSLGQKTLSNTYRYEHRWILTSSVGELDISISNCSYDWIYQLHPLPKYIQPLLVRIKIHFSWHQGLTTTYHTLLHYEESLEFFLSIGPGLRFVD